MRKNDDDHVVHFRSDGLGLSPAEYAELLVQLAADRGIAAERATFSLTEVEAETARAEDGRVSTPVGVISIESPVRRVQGEVFDFAEMQRIVAFARDHQIGLHLDGARLFLASAYTGIAP